MSYSKEEYLKAKIIVEEYEREEFNNGMRQAESDLDEMDGLDDDQWPESEECDLCCMPRDNHANSCPNNESPFANLCRDGYD